MKCVRSAAHSHRLQDTAGSFKSRGFNKRTARGNIRDFLTPIYKCVKLFCSSLKSCFSALSLRLTFRVIMRDHSQQGDGLTRTPRTLYKQQKQQISVVYILLLFFLLHNCVTHKLAFATFLEEKPGIRKKESWAAQRESKLGG